MDTDLGKSEFAALGLFGPESNIIYSLEEYQNGLLGLGANESVEFDSFGHIRGLQKDDFLTLNLLNNNEIGNVLWEWAFEVLYIDTLDEDEFNEFTISEYFVSADNPVVNLVAGVMGRKTEINGEPRSLELIWRVEGDGVLARNRTIEKGVSGYSNLLTMDRAVGSRAKVFVRKSDDEDTEVSFFEVVVIPGEPGVLDVTTSGVVGLDGSSYLVVNTNVTDDFGNLVPDNTPVGFSIAGNGSLSKNMGYTKDGIATVEVTGGFSTAEDGQVAIDSNGSYEFVDFTVVAPTVTVQGIPQNIVEEDTGGQILTRYR